MGIRRHLFCVDIPFGACCQNSSGSCGHVVRVVGGAFCGLFGGRLEACRSVDNYFKNYTCVSAFSNGTLVSSVPSRKKS